MADIISSLNDTQKAELKEINSKINSLQSQIWPLMEQRLELIRKFGRENGFIAEKLEDLKASDGSSFKEYQQGLAEADNGEKAYWCGSLIQLPGSKLFCNGWVKGEPKEEPYNDIGILSGSKGYALICKVCGAVIGHRATLMSALDQSKLESI